MRMFLLAWIAFISIGCVGQNVIPTKNDRPEKLLHISGRKSSTLSVKIIAVYMTANPDCKKDVNWPMSVYLNRNVKVEIPVVESADNYEAVVPLDMFQQGECKWLPFSVNYVVNKGDIALKMPIPPVTLVWIATPGNTDSWFAQRGTQTILPFDVSCQQYTENKNMYLGCDTPLGHYVMGDDATKLNVNFIERDWFSVPFHRLHPPKRLEQPHTRLQPAIS